MTDFEDFTKIGITDDIARRAKDLSISRLKLVFPILIGVSQDKFAHTIEAILHNKFDSIRFKFNNWDTEWFEIETYKLINENKDYLLKLMDEIFVWNPYINNYCKLELKY